MSSRPLKDVPTATLRKQYREDNNSVAATFNSSYDTARGAARGFQRDKNFLQLNREKIELKMQMNKKRNQELAYRGEKPVHDGDLRRIEAQRKFDSHTESVNAKWGKKGSMK